MSALSACKLSLGRQNHAACPVSSFLAAPVSKRSVHAEVYDAAIKKERPVEPVLLHAGYLNGEAKVGDLPSR